MRRTGERQLDGRCVVPFEQESEPNEHNASVPLLDDAFGRDQPTIELQIDGSVPRAADPNAPGSSRGNWHYSFHGSRPE